MTSDRIERVRTAVGIVRLAVQQLRNELAGPPDRAVLAEVLRQLHSEDDQDDSVFGDLAQLLRTTGDAAALTDLDDIDSDDVGCALSEAAYFLQDDAGGRLARTVHTLTPMGETA